MTTATALPAKPIAIGSIVATPHNHRGHCQRWSVCADDAQVSRVTNLHGTTATVVSVCGLLRILYVRDLVAVG